MSHAAVAYSAALAEQLPGLAGADIPWVRERRMEAARRLAEIGFPDSRQERWRHTNVESLFEHRFEPAATAVTTLSPQDLTHLLLDDPQSLRLVLVNGHFVPALSQLEGIPAGVTVTGISQLLGQAPHRLEPYLGAEIGQADGLTAFNAAYSGDGAFIHISPGVRLDRPLDLLYLTVSERADGAAAETCPLASLPYSLILMEEGAEAQVSERFLSLGEALSLTNGLTQVQLGGGARLCHYRCQQEAAQAYHFGRIQVRLGASAHYGSHQLALGARIGRSELTIEYQGERANCALHGLALAHDGQLLDFHTDVEHRIPACATRQHFKAILAGRGRGVFGGRIRVHRQAQHSDAHMRSDNLLLSRNAEMDTLPQLEIYADDVTCGHGATVGQLDPTALFYLRSRGIPESQARHLLTQGFAMDLLEAMTAGPQRRWMEAALMTHLETLHV